MSFLICPICQHSLLLSERSYVCAQKHSFDVSSEGYVNLLVGNKTSSGDEQLMIQARRNFLSGGWYQPLISSLGTIIETYFGKDGLTILDLGCGEGRYMRALQTIRANTQDHYIGLDIAKYAVKIAAKKMSGTFIVGNAYQIPLAAESCDLIVSIFSPFDEKELHRCLKPGGIALIVGPGPEHLYKFIELIRDTPHHHKSKAAEEKYSLLEVVEIKELQIPLSLHAPAVQDLFMMTPYYRQAPKEKQDAILQLDALELLADFRIEMVKKG